MNLWLKLFICFHLFLGVVRRAQKRVVGTKKGEEKGGKSAVNLEMRENCAAEENEKQSGEKRRGQTRPPWIIPQIKLLLRVKISIKHE